MGMRPAYELIPGGRLMTANTIEKHPATTGNMSRPGSKTLMASAIGTVLEWYDFAIYGYLAALISHQFFPSTDYFASLILSYSVFALGYFIRPIGAIFFGSFGDKYGRKRTLIITIILMTLSTFLIGVLPTYSSIGLLAPIALVLLRMLQGFSAGGEFGGAVALVYESSAKNKGFLCAFICTSSCVGILCSSLVMNIVLGIFSPHAFAQYAWRIPFLLSIVTGIVAIYLRLKVVESTEFLQAQATGKLIKRPMAEIVKNHKSTLINLIGLYTICSVSIYLLFVFMPSYLATTFGMNFKVSSGTSTIAMLVLTLFIPFYGWLSDRIHGLYLMAISASIVICVSYPLYRLLGNASTVSLMTIQITFAIIIAAYHGSVIRVILSQLPVQIRYTAYSFGYNLSYSLFGGTAPLIALALMKKTNNTAAPSFYLIFSAVVSLLFVALALKKLKKSNRKLTPQPVTGEFA